MKIFLFILLCFGFCTAVAQDSMYPSKTILRSEPLIVTPPAKRPPGQILGVIGRGLTAGGVVASTVGIIVLSRNRPDPNNTDWIDAKYLGRELLGAGLLAEGIGMIIPGVILWVKGDRRYRAYMTTKSLSFKPTGTGFTIRYSF